MPAHDPEDWLDYLATGSIGDLPPAHVGKLDRLLAARHASTDDELAARP